VEPEDVTIGMRVQVEFTDLPGGDYTIPVFRPATSATP
jgi:uncharacterized OB-fold protein